MEFFEFEYLVLIFPAISVTLNYIIRV